MPRRLAALVALAAVAATGAPGEAKHSRTITKSFQVRGTVPYPAESAMCRPAAHGKDRHVEKLRAPGAGRLVVKLTGFYGDFDLTLTDDNGRWLVDGNNESSTSRLTPSDGSIVETLSFTVRKAQSLQIHACNFLAGPDAEGSYTFKPSH